MADPLAAVAKLPGVAEATENARAAVDRLLAERVLRRRSAEVTLESALRSARASAALDGVDIPLARLRMSLAGARGAEHPHVGAEAVAGATTTMPPAAGHAHNVAAHNDTAHNVAAHNDTAASAATSGSAQAPTGHGHATPAGGMAWPPGSIRPVGPIDAAARAAVVEGALRLYAEFGTMAATWRSAPRQVLAALHVRAARDLPGSAGLGRPRGADAVVTDPLGLGAPPSPTEVAARLGGLCDLLTAPTAAPAIVVAAIVHGELLALRPFGVADGLVARIAARLVLVARGVDPKALTAPEVGHLEATLTGSGYAEAARAYATGTPAGVATWMIHCAQATELGAREGLAICEGLRRSG